MVCLTKWVLASASLSAIANCDAFLSAYPQVQDHELRKEDVEQALLSELSMLVSSAHIGTFVEDLRPLHASAPKNEHGNLEPSVVRYLVHRYFVQKYGWHVKGLERAGGAWNSSSPTNIMKDQTPRYIQSLFEERVHGHGLGLQDLAVFTATLSDLIRNQVVGEMEYLYAMLGMSPSQVIAKEAFYETVLKWYLVGYLHGVDAGATKVQFLEYEQFLEGHGFSWPDWVVWTQDLRHTLDLEQQSRLNPFVFGVSFDRSVHVAEEFAHRLSSFHKHECYSLKDKLVDLEHKGSGRVRLAQFYSGRRDPDWPFLESVEYLRSSGALDETDPKRVSVVIPNYIAAKSNCLHGSDFYSVCCVDECESLMGHIERAIAEPSTGPERLAEVVASLGSDTVDAPRNLSATQLGRLQDIAEYHRGQVPLHGRLFAQWMHHAYPRECPFPHITGTTNPMSPEDWLFDMGSESHYSDEEMEAYLKSQAFDTHESTEALPWTAVEELVASHRHVVGFTGQKSGLTLTRVAVFFAAIVSAALSASRNAKYGPAEVKVEKHLV